MDVSLKELALAWPSPIVARSEVKEFSGGIITPGRLANLDAAGAGPSGRIRIGRKVAYRTAELVRWLESRSEPLD
jgi:hypothetical protein